MIKIIFLILFISAFLRFYNLPNSFVFAGDEEYQAILAQSIISNFHIIWVGVNAAHLGFYLGPFWVYFTAFWLFLSKGDPLITGYVSALIGVLTTLLIILLGNTFFGKKVGFSAGLLYATFPLIVFLDQKYWNPTAIPFLSVLILLSLYSARQYPKWLIIASVCFGLIFHTHLSLVPLIFIAILWLIKQKIKLSKQVIFLSLAAFLITISPLIAFDYFHKGSNITTPLRFKEISADWRNKVNPGHHFQALLQTLGRIWYLKPFGSNSDEVITSCTSVSRIGSPPQIDEVTKRFTPPKWLSFLGFSILVLFLVNKKTWKNKNYTLLALSILSITGSFLLFPGGAFEYYLLGIFPLLVFLPGILATYFVRAAPLVFFTVVTLSVLGIFTVMTNSGEFGLKVKKDLVKQVIAIIDDQPFELKQTGLCHFYEGWRYLFVLNGKKPERSDSDFGLGWLYSEEITKKAVKYTVLLSETRVQQNFDAAFAKSFNSGGFTAYIFKNY